MTTLHVFALNTDPGISHTNLTRALGEAPELPPLGAWLGLESLNTAQVEMFPVKDLGEMGLADYISAAFTPDPEIPAATRQRLDALEGSVLLVPDSAFAIAPTPGPEATAIAELPLARPDHAAELPAADVTARPHPAAPVTPISAQTGRRPILWLLLAALAAAALLWLIL